MKGMVSMYEWNLKATYYSCISAFSRRPWVLVIADILIPCAALRQSERDGLKETTSDWPLQHTVFSWSVGRSSAGHEERLSDASSGP